MDPILILFATSEGQTRAIAAHVGRALEGAGRRTVVRDVTELPADFSLDDYAGVIVGGSIHFGRMQRQLAEFVRPRRRHLEALPNALFVVCMGIASKRAAARAEAEGFPAAFARETGWRPDRTAVFAGAVKYTQYGFITRMLMKAISKREGGGTDTSRDYDYTDWQAVRDFATQFAASLPVARTRRAAVEQPPL